MCPACVSRLVRAQRWSRRLLPRPNWHTAASPPLPRSSRCALAAAGAPDQPQRQRGIPAPWRAFPAAVDWPAPSHGAAADLASNEDVKEFYLGMGGGERKSFKDVKSYKRRKRWLA